MHQELLDQFGFTNPVFYLGECRAKGSESNVSRMARICWKYKIPPSLFYNRYLKDGAKVGQRSFFDFEIACHLNSYTQETVKAERRLNELLGQSDEKYFSYRFMYEFLDRNAHGFVAKRKKWCSRCYHYRRNSVCEEENGIFDDLYWSVDAIKICMLHGCELREKCQNCFSFQPYLSTTSEPGYCHHCNRFLGGGSEKHVEPEELSRQQLQFHLFYISTYDEYRPTFSRFSENLKALQDAFPEASSEHLGSLMGCADDVVRKWITGRRKPQLATLFRLQEVLGLDGIHQLFASDSFFIDKVVMSKNLSLKFNGRSRYRDLMKEAEIRKTMEAMIAGLVHTESREIIAMRFGVTPGYLASRFKNESMALSRAHLHRRALEKEQRDADLTVLMDRAFSMCRSRKRAWTIENIVRELPSGTLEGMGSKDVFMAVQKAKERFMNRRGG